MEIRQARVAGPNTHNRGESRRGTRCPCDALGREHLAGESHGIPSPDAGLADLPGMLAALTPEERIAMVLCYAFGMSHREIAELTETPLGTVKSRIRRGAARIRDRFDIRSSTHG